VRVSRSPRRSRPPGTARHDARVPRLFRLEEAWMSCRRSLKSRPWATSTCSWGSPGRRPPRQHRTRRAARPPTAPRRRQPRGRRALREGEGSASWVADRAIWTVDGARPGAHRRRASSRWGSRAPRRAPPEHLLRLARAPSGCRSAGPCRLASRREAGSLDPRRPPHINVTPGRARLPGHSPDRCVSTGAWCGARRRYGGAGIPVPTAHRRAVEDAGVAAADPAAQAPRAALLERLPRRLGRRSSQ